MPAPPITPGDIFLLFYSFPFDFGADLPIGIGPAVFLDSTPPQILDEANPAGLADFVLPGYSLPGIGLVQCCLRKPVSMMVPGGMTAPNALFSSLAALRLVAPLGIEIAGQFELSNSPEKISSPTLYNLRSSWQPSSGQYRYYTGALIDTASRVADRIMAIRDEKRIFTAYNLFTQVTVGMVSSLQMAIMGLFAALEALFVPKGNYARALATRVARFLSPFQFPMELAKWVEEEYIHARSKLIHGIQDMHPSGKQPRQQGQVSVGGVDPTRTLAFGRLHELVRLSTLGFLSLPDEVIKEHSRKTGTHLQDLVEKLGPAEGEFINTQTAWCN